MTSVAEELIQQAVIQDPNIPAVQLASAALNTVENPSPSNIISDIELAIKIVHELRAKLAGKHPSIVNIIKELL